MKHEPHDFEAPTRRAELKEWLATLRGPPKLDHAAQLREAYDAIRNTAALCGVWSAQGIVSTLAQTGQWVPSHEDWRA